jgi:hypothetical protein
MKNILVIINGARLPYHVIDYAIDKAKKNSVEISVLFLRAKHEQSKGYIFPSDLPVAGNEELNEEAVREDEQLMWDNMQIIKQKMEDEKIPYHSALKTNASVKDVAVFAATADLIVVDKDFDKDSLLADNKISLEKLRQHINKPIDLAADKT